jgi:hypothetical protein
LRPGMTVQVKRGAKAAQARAADDAHSCRRGRPRANDAL